MFDRGGGRHLRFVNVEPPYLGGPPYLTYEYAIVPDESLPDRAAARGAGGTEPDLAAVEAIEPRTVLRVGQESAFSSMGQ